MDNNLHDIATIAQIIGRRPEYVQGGGGNVSLKLRGSLMTIKASGFRLGDLRSNHGFVSLHYPTVREFYDTTESDRALAELISDSDTNVGISLRDENSLRPSIETGFHAILGHCVIHTHSVYANILTCSIEGQDIMHELFKNAVFVPYETPGVSLTFAIKTVLAKTDAPIIFLKNHGLITVGDTPEQAYTLHEQVTKTIRDYFSIKATYPALALRETDTGLCSQSPELHTLIVQNRALVADFTNIVLFPDQVVYGEQVGFNADSKAIAIDLTTGTIAYTGSYGEALAFEETLAAWLSIIEMVREANLTLVTLPRKATAIIANLESEKYRKAILGAKVRPQS
jgi:rhamnose utilization protein RhaD (predicted bifunctional aldolase and dehydrogenase)